MVSSITNLMTLCANPLPQGVEFVLNSINYGEVKQYLNAEVLKVYYFPLIRLGQKFPFMFGLRVIFFNSVDHGCTIFLRITRGAVRLIYYRYLRFYLVVY